MGFPVPAENVFVCSIVVVMEPGSSSDGNGILIYMSTQLIISHRRINKQQNKYTPVTNRCQKPWQFNNPYQNSKHRTVYVAQNITVGNVLNPHHHALPSLHVLKSTSNLNKHRITTPANIDERVSTEPKTLPHNHQPFSIC